VLLGNHKLHLPLCVLIECERGIPLIISRKRIHAELTMHFDSVSQYSARVDNIALRSEVPS